MKYSSRNSLDMAVWFGMHNMVEQPFWIEVVRIDGASQTTPSARVPSKNGANKCRQ